MKNTATDDEELVEIRQGDIFVPKLEGGDFASSDHPDARRVLGVQIVRNPRKVGFRILFCYPNKKPEDRVLSLHKKGFLRLTPIKLTNQ